MTTTRFILTVDGGATKTSMAIWTGAGDLLSKANGRACNIFQDTAGSIAAIEALWGELHSVVGLDRTTDRDKVTLSLGVAGASLRAARDACRDAFADFRHCLISSDGYVSLAGAFGGGPGAVLAVGTGIVGCRFDADGSYTQLSGWGFPVGDRGSGAWLGLQMLADYLQARDGVAAIAESSLWPIIEERIGNDREQILAWLSRATPGDFATFAPAILDAATNKDAEAVDLVTCAVDEIHRLGRQLVGDPPVPLQITGSLGRALKPLLSLEESSARASPHRGALLIGLGDVRPEFER